jgi:HJR/Mrr/RecB family endonuclease
MRLDDQNPFEFLDMNAKGFDEDEDEDEDGDDDAFEDQVDGGNEDDDALEDEVEDRDQEDNGDEDDDAFEDKVDDEVDHRVDNDEQRDGWQPSWVERFGTDNASPVSLRELDIEALRELIDDTEVDEDTGEVIVWVPEIHGIRIPRRARTLDHLRQILLECGWAKMVDPEAAQYGVHIRTGVLFTIDASEPVSADAVEEALDASSARTLFQQDVVVIKPDTRLYQVDAELIVPATKIELATINQELVTYLAKHPKSLYTLEPRRFEELVAELFRDFGYEVLLTPQSKDGGVDIRAVRKDSVGTFLYLIECKRYRQERPVAVDLVRSLYGVVQAERATCGILATTSRFTKEAHEFAKRSQFQLSLRDYSHVTEWLQEYLKRRNH